MASYRQTYIYFECMTKNLENFFQSEGEASSSKNTTYDEFIGKKVDCYACAQEKKYHALANFTILTLVIFSS